MCCGFVVWEWDGAAILMLLVGRSEDDGSHSLSICPPIDHHNYMGACLMYHFGVSIFGMMCSCGRE